MGLFCAFGVRGRGDERHQGLFFEVRTGVSGCCVGSLALGTYMEDVDFRLSWYTSGTAGASTFLRSSLGVTALKEENHFHGDFLGDFPGSPQVRIPGESDGL